MAFLMPESLPVKKNIGDDVFAGTIDEVGSLKGRVFRSVRDNSLSWIIEVDNVGFNME